MVFQKSKTKTRSVYKTLKRVILSSLSILIMSAFVWIILLLNPSLSYANKTQFDIVTVYHNQALEKQTENRIKQVLKIVEKADIYDKDLNIQLCLNDDKVYPYLNPFAGATAYAFMNKTVMYASRPNFDNNITEFNWEINNYELRKYNLTYLLAHEFMHNYQYDYNSRYYLKSTLGKINWKLEGHAEYFAREFKDDGLLKEKVNKCLVEGNINLEGVPTFQLEDHTIQNLNYFKYSLVIQYLMEEKNLSYDQICEQEFEIHDLFNEMIIWSKNTSNN